MPLDPTAVLRGAGLRVTKQRMAVLSALAEAPHAHTDVVLGLVRSRVGHVSTQAVYDVLHTLTDKGIVRRIQPAGSSALYELRVGDNHHHLVCRRCGGVTDIACALGAAPCVEARDLDQHAPGFVVDEAEVTFWGVCTTCATRSPDHDDTSEEKHG
jgi:Fur family transcriptional regulator, stress-responsive regulator